MSGTNKIIRDFLYLDSERLYSLASQVFEGVADRIAESFQSEQSRADVTRTLTGKNIDEKVASAALRTESKLLYDHLYNQLEERLKDVILEPTDVSSDSIQENFGKSLLIKVRGRAVIDDYGRLSNFMERFNELGLSIAIITTLQTGELALAVAEFETKKSSLKVKLHASKNPLEKSQIKATLDEMEHLGQPVEFLTAFAKERNLQHDPAWIASLNVIMEVFRPDTYEISISLPDQRVPVAFRGVIDKRWLRSEPEHLRSLYAGSKIPYDLVMVGQLTYVPSLALNSLLDNPEIAEAEKSMKDVSHDMFRIMSTLDEMMTFSKQRIEMLVRPLAIYQEWLVPPVPDAEVDDVKK